jgi:hypothetical protein
MSFHRLRMRTVTPPVFTTYGDVGDDFRGESNWCGGVPGPPPRAMIPTGAVNYGTSSKFWYVKSVDQRGRNDH